MPPVMTTADSRARAERVVYLRHVAGASWSVIRDQLGFKSVGAAQAAYKSHQKRNPLPGGEIVLAGLRDRQQYRNQKGTMALERAMAAGEFSTVASLIRALAANDADLAKWFGIGSETVNVNVTTTLPQVIAENRERLMAVLDAEVVDTKEIEQ
ncbi:hypothetical protein AOT93_10660 [Mycobacteroides sp. H110]|nr:hypothetical protein AOT87_02450 [Mycobacteroides sp. H003]KRQ28727.1 hypothetical protein AOT91_18100 [Mycobacteroides sp. H092]KRQ51008.1 hypothetical protein AOT88_06345 [Mycobacteroides sp. H063]KRQ57473.1 hypothetical protein AOT94_15995 [Mycobacteroides sp. HXVII]KRQ61860.1 hypothetical protein AOT90_17340 [Mycobacteroides sp. H079]KRQ82122.1 hypothetical protein AOT93_10660 [Mycobacteroides sp. H110]